MRIPFYIADAFTGSPFRGNPAAVCLLEKWPEEDLMRKIAAEFNLSETAFVVRETGGYRIRWFTPKVEVDLCGHATLASAYVLFRFVEKEAASITFQSLSGKLTINRDGSRYQLDFPARPPKLAEAPANIEEIFDHWPQEVLISRDLMLVFENEQIIRQMKPDMQKLSGVEIGHGVIVTAPGDGCDFVSRFFAPRVGVPEDPVTGSIHSALIPYWSGRLQKNILLARQLSARGGKLWCENKGERVLIGGEAALFAQGELEI